ncbi:olfactory receptor 5V1-like [Pelodytes ibericus]
MALDRDLAINSPLRYGAIMTRVFCVKLAFLPWTGSFVVALVPTIVTANLEFCGPNEVNHFLCDLAAIQNIACSNPFVSNVLTNITSIFASLTPFLLIIGFYTHIIITIASIKSREGKMKAFSTCSAHLIVASLFYGAVIMVYMKPNGSPHDKFLALMYTLVIPMVNPFIYTLRNKDVKETIRKLMIVKPLLNH